ncbi:MAG: hypothetical protein AAGJ37_10325 [Pseudomonadota bacterium]
MNCLSESEFQILEKAIYFLKVDELKHICGELECSASGQKQDIIDAILQAVKSAPRKTKNVLSQPNALQSIQAKRRSDDQSRKDPDVFIIPGKYTNNRVQREKFKQLIGGHFSFTSFGMDWIKQQWEKGKYPSYDEFAAFWQAEYERRKKGGSFTSKATLQRVTFFREMKGKYPSKTALESAWKEKREEQASIALSLLQSLLKKS